MAKSPKKSTRKKLGDPVPVSPPPPAPCTCCDGKPSGVVYCEDNGFRVLAWPAVASVLAFDPAVSALPYWKAV